MPPAVYRDCDESRVTCMKNHEWWLCHKYDVNYMIMQSNMTMMKRVITNGTVESCTAIYLRMAMEGGCFEEDIRRLMCDRAYRIMGFGCTSEVCTNSRGEKGQCTVPKRLAMMEG